MQFFSFSAHRRGTTASYLVIPAGLPTPWKRNFPRRIVLGGGSRFLFLLYFSAARGRGLEAVGHLNVQDAVVAAGEGSVVDECALGAHLEVFVE